VRASVLQSAASNLRFDKGTVALFESARIYLSQEGDLPEERERIVGIVAGRRLGRWGDTTSEWVDFFDAKGILEEVLDRVGARVEFRADQDFGLLRGRTASIVAAGEGAGMIGEVHPHLASRFDIEGPAFIFDLDVERLLPAISLDAQHRPLSRFPAVIQDIAVIVDGDVPAEKVHQIIAGSSMVAGATLFDVYEGPPLPHGKRSLAFAVRFQAPDRTLADDDVADARRRIVRRLEREVGAELRGG
jgi:phenylalanyl-tRNA synthetase beta chain